MKGNGNITENGHTLLYTDNDVKDTINIIRQYLETHVRDLTAEAVKKDTEIKYLKDSLEKARHQMEGNSQLINKLLGELNKLQNDIEWYKRTYEKRSFLGTIREKMFRRH